MKTLSRLFRCLLIVSVFQKSCILLTYGKDYEFPVEEPEDIKATNMEGREMETGEAKEAESLHVIDPPAIVLEGAKKRRRGKKKNRTGKMMADAKPIGGQGFDSGDSFNDINDLDYETPSQEDVEVEEAQPQPTNYYSPSSSTGYAPSGYENSGNGQMYGNNNNVYGGNGQGHGNNNAYGGSGQGYGNNNAYAGSGQGYGNNNAYAGSGQGYGNNNAYAAGNKQGYGNTVNAQGYGNNIGYAQYNQNQNYQGAGNNAYSQVRQNPNQYSQNVYPNKAPVPTSQSYNSNSNYNIAHSPSPTSRPPNNLNTNYNNNYQKQNTRPNAGSNYSPTNAGYSSNKNQLTNLPKYNSNNPTSYGNPKPQPVAYKPTNRLQFQG